MGMAALDQIGHPSGAGLVEPPTQASLVAIFIMCEVWMRDNCSNFDINSKPKVLLRVGLDYFATPITRQRLALSIRNEMVGTPRCRVW